MRLLLVVSAWAFAMPGFAQTAPDPGPVSVVETAQAYTPEPAHIAFIDGVADVTRDGRAEPASINVPLVAGDQVRTKNGRMEVLFGDGSVLDLDHFTTVDFLSDELVRLTDGCVRLTIGGRDRVAYRVDTPSAAVRIEAPGEYRIALVGESGRRDVELVAVRGYATLVNEFGETSVRAGERAFATSTMAPSYAQAYNSATWDAFDRWSADRSDERTGATSSRYLPDEIRGYAGDFDRYGAWQYDAGYGYVWYPRVRVDWRPYYYGRWSYYGPWGWTWIAYDRWGWPTHHYGRWGLRAGLWFWIPSRRWAPAHVYWAGASDYIGWCPLGWDNRPIFSIINVNINIGRGYRGYDPYRAWTVLPRYAFRNHVDVGRYAVARDQIDRAVPRWYVSGASAPIRPALTTRDVSPIYSAGRGIRGGASISNPRSAPVAGTAAQEPGVRSANRDRAVARDSAATREYRAGAPTRDMPRATAPAAAGALGPSTRWERPGGNRTPRSRTGDGWPDTSSGRPGVSRATPRNAPYRDAGPGGPEPRYALPAQPDRSPYQQPYGRSRPGNDAPDYGRSVGAPRGVPNGGIYGQRGVPREQDSRVYAPRGVPRGGVYSPPSQRDEPPATIYPAPSRPSRARPEGYGGGGGGVYVPRSSGERPSYGPPSAPPAPRGAPGAGRPGGGDRGNDRGGDRAAPRGGSSAPSRPSGGHSRGRPGGN